MAPLIHERPKMTRSMYMALKRHIMREREKKKQEQEQDAEQERLRKEREQRKKKEEQDSLTLEQTKEQISQLEMRLEKLKHEKHEMFSQLKKVLHEDETRKRAKEQSEMLHMQQQLQHQAAMQTHHHPMFMQTSPMSGRPSLYKPMHTQQSMVTGVKRPRSPSPTPPQPSIFQPAYNKYAASGYTPQVKKEPTFNSSQSRQQTPPVSYANQSSGQYPPSQQTHGNKPSPAPSQYPAASQSAFTSYPGHYISHGKMGEHYPKGFPVGTHRVPQQAAAGYMGSAQTHQGGQLPLQQQLEHANAKSGFNDDKYKMQQQIRGITPINPHQQPIVAPTAAGSQPVHAAPPQQKGSIMSGYPVRTQPTPTSTTYPTSTTQGSYQQTAASATHTFPPQPGRGYY